MTENGPERLGHYVIEGEIGRGGMGVVYRARDVRLHRPVALKVLKEELTDDASRRARFLQEARSASAVTHPAIAQIYDVDEIDGVTFIAMEFVEGQTVLDLVERQELDLPSSVEIAWQVAEGLARAHEAGIIHRDIKTENIMVTPDGHAKILDFGLAKLTDPSAGSAEERATLMATMAQTQAGTVLGTIAYMSPEQARGQEVDPRSDIFSLGVVLYEMVTGDRPFAGDSPLDTMHAIAYDEARPVTVVRKNLPPQLHRVVSRCLRKKPADRYSDARGLATDLKTLKRDIDSGIQRPLNLKDRAHEFSDWVKGSLPVNWAGVAALALGAGLITYLLFVQVDIGTVITLAFLGLLLFRWVRNRRPRMIKRLVKKMSRQQEVKAVRVVEDRITLFVDEVKARTYVRVNGLLDQVNQKRFFGNEVQVEVRDDVSPGEFLQALREPGIAYVREDALKGPD